MTEQTIRTQMLLGEAALARLRSSRVLNPQLPAPCVAC